MTNYNDGKWHGWNGGDCPVHQNSRIQWTRYNGIGVTGIAYAGEGPARDANWETTHGSGGHLSAFRVTKEHREPREFWINKSTEHAYPDPPDHERLNFYIHVREVQE